MRLLAFKTKRKGLNVVAPQPTFSGHQPPEDLISNLGPREHLLIVLRWKQEALPCPLGLLNRTKGGGLTTPSDSPLLCWIPRIIRQRLHTTRSSIHGGLLKGVRWGSCLRWRDACHPSAQILCHNWLQEGLGAKALRIRWQGGLGAELPSSLRAGGG